MAIIGLTHNEEGAIEDKVIKYRGKISSGWGPKEGDNKENYPVAAGKFLIMREDTVNKRIGSKTVPVTKWVLNTATQAELEKVAGSKTPRSLETVCLVKDPRDLWSSFLAMYSGGGLACRSGGLGTTAKYLEFDGNGERKWKERTCTFDKCPFYIAGDCKARGEMRIYPTVDATPPNPYKFTTSSLNTIRNIESSLEDIWNLIKTAHVVKETEAGKQLGFDGMFGLKLYLNHKKTRSGGRDVFVTEIVTSKQFRDNIMSIINREITRKVNTEAIEGANVDTDSLLDHAATVMIEAESIEIEAEEVEVKEILSSAAEALEDEE